MLKELPTTAYLSVAQAAQRLNVSTQTLRNWTDEGRIDGYVTEGGHRRYLEPEVNLLALHETAKAQGKDGAQLYEVYCSVERDGDKFSIYYSDTLDMMEDDGTERDAAVGTIGDIDTLPIVPSPSPLRITPKELMDESLNSHYSGCRRERKFLVDNEGKPQVRLGSFDDNELTTVIREHGAVVTQVVRVTALSEREAIEHARIGLRQSYEYLLKNAVPQRGVYLYLTADGQRIPSQR